MMEERGNNYTLTVADVRQTDLGEYSCSAVNKIGEGQAKVLLTGEIAFLINPLVVQKNKRSKYSQNTDRIQSKFKPKRNEKL